MRTIKTLPKSLAQIYYPAIQGVLEAPKGKSGSRDKFVPPVRRLVRTATLGSIL